MMEASPWREYRLSRLMIGTAQFGQPYGVANRTGPPNDAVVRSLLAAAAEAGVNCLDTAAAYGASEEVLGRALAELGLRDRFVVVTKVRPNPADADAVVASVNQSRRRLGLERLPVVLFHRGDDFRHLDALLRLQAEGVIGHVGMSCDHSPAKAGELLASGLLAALQLPANVFDRRHQQAGLFRAAAARGVAVFVRSVYLQGLLVMPDAAIPPALAAVRPARRQLEALAGEAGMSLAELALRWMLSQPGVTSVLTGVETLEQLRANIAMAGRGPLPPDLLAAIDAVVPELPDTVLTPALWPVLPAAAEPTAPGGGA
jgi:aryl-alcohol dehydrogenase-like predicted oxidoreductase